MNGAAVIKDIFHVKLVKIELFKINISAWECLIIECFIDVWAQVIEFKSDLRRSFDDFSPKKVVKTWDSI